MAIQRDADSGLERFPYRRPDKPPKVVLEQPANKAYSDGSPVRQNRHGVVLRQFARGGGRPPLEYDRNYHPEQCREFAKLGLTEAKMARFFRVSKKTFSLWKRLHCELRAVLKD